MRFQLWALGLAAILAGGCANGLTRPTAGGPGSLPVPELAPGDSTAVQVAGASETVRRGAIAFASDQADEDEDRPQARRGSTGAPAARLAQAEEIARPQPTRESFKPAAEDEASIDRFNRSIMDVPVDIRPTQGLLPEDVGAEKFAAEPTIDESLPSGEPAHVFCAYTPWTICYRPLYFEDIALERYGKNVGYFQTGLSGVRFFTQVAALPYKMTRRPPRSCECSNGFSRPGDCPLPGYGNRRFELDAALVEAAAVTAFVYIIP
jgi:hypothetical protein